MSCIEREYISDLLEAAAVGATGPIGNLIGYTNSNGWMDERGYLRIRFLVTWVFFFLLLFLFFILFLLPLRRPLSPVYFYQNTQKIIRAQERQLKETSPVPHSTTPDRPTESNRNSPHSRFRVHGSVESASSFSLLPPSPQKPSLYVLPVANAKGGERAKRKTHTHSLRQVLFVLLYKRC
ncbi:hypothetical protein F5B18DRAFT_450925 [Nemania serpens]|nr:hypothetical protein F5B18DRAFT_450925 [Nemania serpens]